ncbi:serine/threonine-protein kinase [Tahibacter aquaticus]|uniref:Serine/threonine-protein kinase n=1 Tax=Tahibacter aquaticus TaxID=520092 RepID=A0A4R6YWY7_9GAMM|nr:serine/threonine-protein kinase [Tahibacter aquaticus]TDR43217.1 serine/threonine-protein kinase [Tahibacter aquaticus]
MNDTSDIELKRRAYALLREALELAPSQREVFVTAHCAGDTRLQAVLQQLLAAESAPHLLDGSAATVAERLAAHTDDELAAGTQIAGWNIQRCIGRGGMGAVFLVERSGDGYVQHGALKWIKRGMDSGEILARFRRERRILAQLQHPLIARLLDGGISESGQPWFVMEYVDGVPLQDWAATSRPTLAQRLDLFRQLAEAVAYAHGQLVVHRDLKPGNVLVDAQGLPHLLDFGVAKVLEEDGTDARTSTGARFLSRAYAAPEQIRGEAIGTAVDVYALGVLLFELLSGARFHDNPAAQSGPVSERLSKAAGTGSAVPPRQLRGDLAVIVARATDAEPARRYPTAQALADDVQRFLRGAPILARRDSGWYRLRRLVTRHKLASAALLFGLAAIIAGSALALWQARRAAHEAELARAAQRFLTGVFDASAPDAASGNRITARELLDQGSARIGEELAGQPALQAEMRQTLGTLYRQLGQFDKAAELLDQARSAFQAENNTSSLVENALQLAQVRREQAQYAQALELLTQTQQQTDDPRQLSALLAERAQIEDRQGKFADGLASIRAATALSDRLGIQGLAEQARDHQLEALLLARLARYDEADAAFRDAIARAETAYGNEHSQLATVHNDYAVMLLDRQSSAAGEREARIGLDMRRKRLGLQHAAVGESLTILGIALRQQGKLEESAAVLGEALAIQRAALGQRHPAVASTLNSLANLAMSQQDFPRMVDLLSESRAIFQENHLGDSPQGRTVDSNLGIGLTRLERLDEAEPLLRAALARNRQAVGDMHPLVMSSLNGLSQWERRRGNGAAAEANATEALAIADKLLAGSRDNAAVRQTLGAAQLINGHAEAARDNFRSCRAVLEKLGAQAEPRYAGAMLGQARAELALGHAAQASELAQALLDNGASYGAGSAAVRAMAWAIMAEAARNLGQPAQALAAQKEAERLLPEWTNPDPENLRQFRAHLGQATR